MENTKEAIAALTVVAGDTGYSVDFTPLTGHVIGCVVYTSDNGVPNTGFVRAIIKDSAGKEISRLQSIENYRSRDAAYRKGCKPLNIMTDGQSYTFEVIGTAAFGADYNAELIFIYAPDTCNT